MKAKPINRWQLMITLVLLWTAGCSLLNMSDQALSSEERVQTKVAGTMIATFVAETLAAPAGVPAVTEAVVPNEPVPPAEIAAPTFTLSPTITDSPTVTLTPTLEKPMVSVSRNTYCRTGPGEPYDSVGTLMEGEQAEVVGVSSDGQTWIIKNPDRAGECWLWGYYAMVVGPIDGLPVYTPPPTPTPAFDWSGSWSVVFEPVGGGEGIIWDLTAAVAGKTFIGDTDIVGCLGAYIGTISDDYLSVSGNWSDCVESGTFKIFSLGVDQFQGYQSDGTTEFGFCGSRGGAGYPSPCYRK